MAAHYTESPCFCQAWREVLPLTFFRESCHTDVQYIPSFREKSVCYETPFYAPMPALLPAGAVA